MEDISFTTFQNNQLEKTTAQDLLKNKRVLICSVVRPYQNLPYLYINQIIDKMPFYKEHGIDEVYIVNSANGLHIIALLEKNFPKIVALSDNDARLVEYLRIKMGKEHQTLDYLSKYWSYQVLFNDGEIEHFNEQPTEKIIKNLVNSGNKINLKTQKFFITEGEDLAIQRPALTDPEQMWNENGLVFYYNLWPNRRLEQYLLDTKQ